MTPQTVKKEMTVWAKVGTDLQEILRDVLRVHPWDVRLEGDSPYRLTLTLTPIKKGRTKP